MLGAAGNLALMPEYRVFVIVSILAYIVLFWIIETRIGSSRARRAIEVGMAAVFIVITMTWSAYHYVPSLLIAKGAHFEHVGSLRVQLNDVKSLRGWGEGQAVSTPGHEELLHGDHRVNRGLSNARWIFDRIFDRMGLPHRNDVLTMSQQQWFAFLRDDLDPVQQRQIGKIPFAIVDVQTADGAIQTMIMFRNDRREVRDRSGASAGFLCMDRIFDVPDVVSGEREAVLISVGAPNCD